VTVRTYGLIHDSSLYPALYDADTEAELLVVASPFAGSVGIARDQPGAWYIFDTAWRTNSPAAGGGGGGGLAFTTVEKDLGAQGLWSGSFDITGLAGLVAGKQVLVVQKPGPYTGKGNREDEVEMDVVQATGYVVDAATIRVFWAVGLFSGPMKGNVKFGYAVSA
jgi:hypothetical protein